MKKLHLLFLALIFSISAMAQEFSVPQNFEPKSNKDYAAAHNDVVDCVDWMMATPLNEQIDKRKKANAFLLQFLTGSPDVHIGINPNIVTFMESSPELLMIFMGGWAKYSIENNLVDDAKAGSLAGIEAVIDFYSKNRSFMSKDKHVEKYIKMKNKRTLKDYVDENA